MSERIYINDDWKFSKQFDDSYKYIESDFSQMEDVRIPHTVKETPFNYFDEKIYQMVSGYVKVLKIPKEWEGKSVRLTFEGVAHEAEVFVNGISVGIHSCGYTAFSIDITNRINYGIDNLITVKVDSRETLNQPPFGFVIDYMTYGGIYRNVYVEISDKTYINDVFVVSEITGNEVRMISELDIKFGGKSNVKLTQFIDDKPLNVLENNTKLICKLEDVELWSLENPKLYDIRTVLSDIETDEIIDEKTVRFGFRKSEFKNDGYYLNDKKIKIRGLNRHQSYPYVGYAMPDNVQKTDADILKNELSVNAVRTSHYPQSQSFIDRCDEIGLLVFTEMPGWQHIGEGEWKDKAVENVSEMILQYRNHPSIILWGVRINESKDDDEFYERTNALAHKLDPSRPTGGVRCYKKGNLLEDVYTYNDFLHDGKAYGCEKKKNVTSDMSKPYMVSEYNGHMYPTKSFDGEEHRREHALRHAKVLDSIAGEEDIVGSFGWCMFDYNTHKDFGSGDRICYHGVMDMFRNPKLAASVYSSQEEKETVLELSSSMDIGEHPASNRGETYIFTNADSVRMYKNDRFIKEYFQEDSEYKNLKHGPIMIDDFIGNAIEEGETKLPSWARKDLKNAMNATARYGLSNLPKKYYLILAKLVLFAHMNPGNAVSLYNKYVGDWGGKSTMYRFDAVKNGQVVKTITKAPTESVHFDIKCDRTELKEEKNYDVAMIRIRTLDDFDNQVSFFNEPISLSVEGPIEIIGPKVVGLKGGMTGVFVKTTGETGNGKLTISNPQCGDYTVDFVVTK